LNTDYHTKIFAHELSLLQAGDSVDRLSSAMFDACIDLNPHQINAAIFALKNPLSRGCILADEVGLGKTIETGLVLSQLWAEGKRSFLIIAPKSLRHQWKDELKNLFFLDSEIMSGQDFKKFKSNPKESPLNKSEKIIITNEHSVDSFHEIIENEKWDLIIIDEAHKLRNVWKKGKNEAKRAKRIKEAIKPFKKLLLTATPMQNNLMELYGLTSFIDDYILGSRDSFQALFCNLTDAVRDIRMIELRERMQGFFRRELRKNVLEYINYTKRNAVTFTYDPTDYEEELRIKFEEFLRREVLISIPASALPLLTLVYLKLIASSTFAIKNSLLNLYKRLLWMAVTLDHEELFNKMWGEAQEELLLENGKKSEHLERLEKLLFWDVPDKTYQGLRKELRPSSTLEDVTTEEKEVTDNYSDQDLEDAKNLDEVLFKPEEIEEEARLILDMIGLSLKITENRKADALVDALTQQFEKARNEGWPEKAVIFTEFRSTQEYILKKLKEMGLDTDRDVVIFNGDSGDAESRRELVNQFKADKKIFLTTEAGSEGLNLQFCNLLVNYDLPWNPQRIEQRIGRCHRYGQKLDVVVVNFVNNKNIADRRVLELLQEKFSLFKGAFGASDEVLGDIEDGHDVEKEILKIYLSCRTEDEINKAFENLQVKSATEISSKLKETKEMVLENFDENVHSKLKLQLEEAERRVDKISEMFWAITKNVLSSHANFNNDEYKFDLTTSPFDEVQSGVYQLGNYKMIGKGQERDEDDFTYRLGHPLGQKVIEQAKNTELEAATLEFDLTRNNSKISILEPYLGKSGFLLISQLYAESLDHSEELVWTCVDENGDEVSDEIAKSLFKLNGKVTTSSIDLDTAVSELIQKIKKSKTQQYLKRIEERNNQFFVDESEKLDKWSEDVKEGLEIEIKNLDKEIKKKKKEAKTISVLEEKVKAQRSIKGMEKKRNDMRRKLFEEQDRIEEEKEKLIEEIEQRMKLNYKENEIAKLKWKLI
tara:strand:+ start:2370 stop:5351 length:2982 start_codon:yes stop_codon:yes gene_type:complete